MKNLLKKVEFAGLNFAVLAMAFVCAGLLGCSSCFEEDTHYEWALNRQGKKIVGFLDDSLAIVSDYRFWYEIKDDDGDQVGIGMARPALYLYNYRVQLNGPVWVDSLDDGFGGNFNYTRGQLSDSVIWGSDAVDVLRFENYLSFWKLGEMPVKIKIKRQYDNCSNEVVFTRLREWTDGKIIAVGEKSLGFGADSCNYAILDTSSQMITYKRLNDEMEWIRQCDDVRAWGGDVYCLVIKDNPLNLYVLKNNKILDALLQGEPLEWTEYSRLDFMGEVLKLDNNMCKIKEEEFVCFGVQILNGGESPVWHPGISFEDENFGKINY